MIKWIIYASAKNGEKHLSDLVKVELPRLLVGIFFLPRIFVFILIIQKKWSLLTH